MKLAENAEDIENRGCQLVSLTEKLNTDIPREKLVFMVFAAPAQIRV